MTLNLGYSVGTANFAALVVGAVKPYPAIAL